MSTSLAVPWNDDLIAYDFGPSHPLAPVRVELTIALARSYGVLSRGNVELLDVTPADEDLLALVHTPDYIEAVQRASTSVQPDLAHGLGTMDDPVFAGMHDAAALVAGATVAAARAVHEGRHQHAANIAGGLHHAMASTASGFCIYNDPAIAIAWLLRQGVERIAYVDIDVHHGDGVQAAFWDDPRVLTISLHESGRTLFPGTGFAHEVGGDAAPGSAVNIALPAGTGDAGWLRALHAVVPPLVREFAPQILVSQHGCDSHALDPLANLLVSLDGQRVAHAALHGLAHEVCDGRWLVTGGGGYELVRVVPRTWTHLLAEASGEPLDPELETPEEWREFVVERTGSHGPTRMTDGRSPEFRHWEGGAGVPGDRVDAAVQETRNAVFMLHGLDPLASA
ncbi:MAG TPA: acetoin utilization protein AcuC [Mycobacteriales bacterium]|nr:acetoin utilization protein AcuC [Mycobacteriales bacterium]